MDAIRSVSSAFNLPLPHFCIYAALLLLLLRLLKSSPRSIPSKASLLSQIASSSAVYGKAAATMLQPSADHRQRLRSGDAWQKVEQVERDLGHVQACPASPAPDADFMLPSKIVTRHLHVALTSDSDTFNLYTVRDALHSIYFCNYHPGTAQPPRRLHSVAICTQPGLPHRRCEPCVSGAASPPDLLPSLLTRPVLHALHHRPALVAPRSL